MSRWSAERLHIGLAPGRVDVLRLGARLGRAAPLERAVPCEPVAGQPAWQAALQALQAPLAELGRRGEGVAVVLSNHFVRYLVLPWQAELSGATEIEAWARLQFEQTFGAAASEWTLRIAAPGWGRPLVACAVDAALLEQLGQQLTALGLRLASLQPLLMAAYNTRRRGFKGATALAVVEAGRVCLGVMDPQGWRQIASRRAGADDDTTAAIEQELALLDSHDPAPRLEVLQIGAPGPLTLARCGVA